MSYTVLARRYRSRDFDEVVGQEPIARTLQNAIKAERIAHAYLFCGTRGVGKTSMARILARALNVTADQEQADEIAEAILRGDDLDVIEIDGASNRGIQEARDLIASAGLSPARSPYKIYIIDEVHMLTREAFNALLKTMEEPPEHVKFILCTTDPQKVPPTIQSRCQRFDFRAISTGDIAGQLRHVLGRERIEAEDDVVLQVARLGHGSMRDALSLLDRLIAATDGRLTLADAEPILGLPDHAVVRDIVQAVIDTRPDAALAAGAELISRGATVEQALDQLTEHLRALLIVAACGAESELLELAPDAAARAIEQAGHFDLASLVHMIALCDATARNARGSATARALLDAVLVRLCLSAELADAAAVTGGAATSVPPREPVTAGAKKKHAEPAVELRVERDVTPASEPTRTAGVVEVKEPGPETLWPAVLAAAQAAPKDQAKVRDLEFVGFDGRTLRLTVRSGAPSARFLATQTDSVRELVKRATRREVKVVIATPAAADHVSAPAAAHADLAAVQREPVVRQAMEIFDARVTGVEKRGAGSTGEGEQDV
ncbi:MAG: DNA polymerase III subunit gamma/tau [Phycisphaerales bacterium]|nr:DNA polymerase III subunit gamma/tau [Phycisphaerales bacterium]